MKIDYQSKVVAVTGAAGALGSEMAVAFAANGAKVAVCGHITDDGSKTLQRIAEIGGEAEFFPFDVSDREQAKKSFEKIVDRFGKLDILVNNAGVNVKAEDRGPIHEFKDDKWDWIRSVDLDGVYNCSKAAIPYIIKNGGGNILNISSVLGMVPFRNQCAFIAAKAAVINLSKAMALELAPNNIRVNVVAPGSIAMNLTAQLWKDEAAKEALLSHIPMHRQGSPDDIANAVLFLCDDDSAKYITGTVLNVDGGWICGYARDF